MDAVRQAISGVSMSALESIRQSLGKPSVLGVFALAAGLSAAQSQAWAGNFEYVGRSIGYEMGRAAGSGPQGRIASLVLQTAGGTVAGQLDSPPPSSDQRRAAELQRQAREQAARDAAYVNERRRIDPGYVEPTNGTTGRSQVNASSASMTSEQRRVEQVQKEAREQAIRDSAYQAERRRLDPTYSAMVQRSDQANAQSAAVQRINQAYGETRTGDQTERRRDMEAP